MASVNKVILMGNLGRDPEVRYLPSGDPVANITIATSSRYKSKTGEMVEETEWHRVTFFGRLAEIASQYLKKGYNRQAPAARPAAAPNRQAPAAPAPASRPGSGFDDMDDDIPF